MHRIPVEIWAQIISEIPLRSIVSLRSSCNSIHNILPQVPVLTFKAYKTSTEQYPQETRRTCRMLLDISCVNQHSFVYICKAGHSDEIKRFAARNEVCLNTYDEKGYHPIHYVCEFGNVESLNMIMHHASLNTNTRDGKPSSHILAMNMFVASRGMITSFHLNGGDVNSRNIYGFHCLHVAATIGNSAFITELMSISDVDLDVVTATRDHALHLAVKYQQIGVFKVLLDSRRVDINFCNLWDGNTAAHYAIRTELRFFKELVNICTLDFDLKNRRNVSARELVENLEKPLFIELMPN